MFLDIFIIFININTLWKNCCEHWVIIHFHKWNEFWPCHGLSCIIIVFVYLSYSTYMLRTLSPLEANEAPNNALRTDERETRWCYNAVKMGFRKISGPIDFLHKVSLKQRKAKIMSDWEIRFVKCTSFLSWLLWIWTVNIWASYWITGGVVVCQRHKHHIKTILWRIEVNLNSFV